jgi:hypothetical protein
MIAIAPDMGQDDEQEPGGLIHMMREKAGVIIGVTGLIAWLAMLWFMFGDVL